MKNVKKAICLGLSLCTLGTSLFAGACGGSNENREDTLYVAVINKGYGLDWIYGLLDAYCAKHEGLKYELAPAYDDSTIRTKVETGVQYCNYDLIFTGAREPADGNFLADLSDVYAYQYESGTRAGQTVEASMESRIKKAMTKRSDGLAYKVMPWTSSTSGLMINEKVMVDNFGTDWQNIYKLRTTNELLELCADLAEKEIPAFLHNAATNTYGSMFYTWFAQYNGVEGVDNFYNGIYVDELGKKKIGPEVALNKGTEEAAKAMESVFGAGYSHKDSNGYQSAKESQTFFFLGKSALYVNGDWLKREMSMQFPNAQIRMYPIPVLSSIGTKYGITEEQLLTLIDYVDATNDGLTAEKPNISTDEYTADELIEEIREARSWDNTIADYNTAAVTSYSTKLDVAKDFLKFMCSDEGQEIYVNKLDGLTMCYGYDLKAHEGYSSLPTFAKDRWEIVKNATYHYVDFTTKYGEAGLKPFAIMSQGPLEVLMSRTNNKKSAKDVYDYDYEYYRQVWNTYEN